MSPDMLYVHATSDGTDVGGARFKKIDGVWTGDIVHIYPQFRRQGVATKIYDYAEELVGKINPSKTLKPKGKKFWSSRDTQGVAEGKVINTYLWHGSRQKIPMLEPRQSVDTGGAAGSNQNAIYATSDPKVAIAMGLTTAGSDTGMFPNDPQMVLFSGKIRKGEYVYLHKLPFNGPDGKPQFVQGGNSREFHSIPGVEGIKPIEIKEIPVNKYLNLIRKATPADLKLRKRYMKKQGVAEGIEDNYNKNDAGIKATLQAGVKLIPIQSNNHATGKPIYIHDYSGRYTVLVDMGGISVPYYVSTGLGGKAGVAVDKWYPFFGIGSDGWINKGSEANINDFYGSNKLKRVAQVLNNTLGLPSRAKNVSGWPGNRGDENYFISAVNRGLDPAPRSDHSTKIRDNMLSVLLRLSEPNKYVEKASPTQATRPKGIVFDKNNPEHVASFNATSQSERELATALAKEPKGVA